MGGIPDTYRTRSVPEKPCKGDSVNHPSHYNQGTIEIIDFIEDWKLDFNSGNVIKYVTRAPYKENKLEDLKKARFYLDRLITLAEYPKKVSNDE